MERVCAGILEIRVEVQRVRRGNVDVPRQVFEKALEEILSAVDKGILNDDLDVVLGRS